MCLAAALGVHLGELAAEHGQRLAGLLDALGLPTRPPDDVAAEALLAHMRLDKKNRDGRIRLILLDAPGAARLRDDIDENTLLEFLKS
jgi:3-dehydroquinate synthase